MSSTTIVFNADAANFLNNLAAMKKSLVDNGDAVSRAKAKIIEALELQTTAALKANRSQQELDRIQTRGAERLAQVTEQNATRTSAALDRLLAKQRAVAVELQKLGRITVPDSGGAGHGFTDRMAVSAVTRTVSGNPGIRSIENALTIIPGFASAAQGLAPLIGFAGLTGLFVEMGAKGYEAFEKVTQAAQHTREAFADLHDHQAIALDDLELQNQKLQDQIDKLSGRPNNGVATALLEAKKMADELLVSLEADEKQLLELFKQQDTGTLGSVLSSLGIGPASTGTQEEQIGKDFSELQTKIRGIDTDFNKALSGASTDAERKAAVDARTKRTHDAYQALIDSYTREQDRLNNSFTTTVTKNGVIRQKDDNSKGVENIAGALGILQNAQSREDLTSSIFNRESTIGGLKEGDEAAAGRLKAIETQFAELHTKLPEEALAFWTQYNGAFKQGSSEYLRVVEEIDKYTDEFEKGLTRSSKLSEALKALQKKDDAGFMPFGKPVDLTGNSAESARALADEYARANLAGTQLQAQMAKARVGVDLADGSISKLSADQQLAAIAAQEHADRIAELQRQMAELRNNPANGYNPVLDRFASDHAQQQYISLKVGLDKESADAAIDQMQSTAKIAADSWQGALREANARWVQDARDTAQQVVAISQQAINGLNENLVKQMFGEKTNWSGYVRGIGQTIATDGLKRLEAAGLKSFGAAGKPDGTKQNPLNVLLANGLSGGKAGLTSFDSLMPGWDDSDSGSSGPTPKSNGSGFLSHIVGFASMFFGGGKALGGAVMPGMSYDVGEFGRERFTPSMPGFITPHNQLGDGGVHYTMYVANGVTPEQMHQHVTAALQQFHPVVVRDSVNAGLDRNRRLPSSRS